MNNTNDSLQTLQDIKSIMDRSSKVLSLSGWSGVFAGIVALIGGTIAWIQLDKIKNDFNVSVSDRVGDQYELSIIQNTVPNLLLIAVITLFVALLGAAYFTHRKIKNDGVKLWSSASRRLLEALSLPLGIGGILCIFFMMRQDYTLIAPISLIFYGLALVNTSKYTLSETKSLGYIIIILGMINLHFPNYGLQFWMIGFGVMHIVYGIWMWNRYDRKS